MMPENGEKRSTKEIFFPFRDSYKTMKTHVHGNHVREVLAKDVCRSGTKLLSSVAKKKWA